MSTTNCTPIRQHASMWRSVCAAAPLLAAVLAAPAAQASDGAWVYTANMLTPAARFGHSAAYDPLRDRVIVLDGSPGIGMSMLSDLWQLSTTPGAEGWSPLAAAGPAPQARYTASEVYDPIRDRMIVFGGDPGGGVPFFNDVWSLSLSAPTPAWAQLAPTGTLPDGRSGQAMVYDSARDRMLVVCGQKRDGTVLGDVWELTLGPTPAWTKLTTSGSQPVLAFHSAVYDPIRDRVLVYGGFNGFSTENGLVYALDLASATWSTVTTTGASPLSRYGHAAAYDAARDAMVVFGGTHAGGYVNQVLSLSLASAPNTWSIPLTSGKSPAVVTSPSLSYDSAHARLVTFAGLSITPTLTRLTVNQAFTLDPAAGYNWQAIPTLPTPRAVAATAVDATHRLLYAFGGFDGLGATNDLFAYDFATHGWFPVTPATVTAPGGRWGSGMVFDAARNRLVVFGGFQGDVNGAGSGLYFNDLWAFDVATGTWSQLAPAGSPPSARRQFAMVIDPALDEIVVFGGYTSSGTFRNDAYALSLAGAGTWSQLAPSGTPPTTRASAAAACDPLRHRLLVFGGSDCCNNYGDAFALTLTGSPAWSLLAANGSGPSGRTLASGDYDVTRDAFLIFGGGALPNTFNDAWELSLGASPTWRLLSLTGPPPATRSAAMFGYDPLGDGAVVAYGSPNLFYTPYRTDTWEMDLTTAPTAVRVSPAQVTARPGAVELSWRISQDPGDQTTAVLWRREGGEWTERGPVAIHQDGQARIVDSQVESGRTYQYRLRLNVAGTEQWTEIVTALVPASSAGVDVAPAVSARQGSVAFGITLDAAANCRAQLCDVTGRTVAQARWTAVPAGRTALALPLVARTGVYLLTVSTDGASWVRKVLVMP